MSSVRSRRSASSVRAHVAEVVRGERRRAAPCRCWSASVRCASIGPGCSWKLSGGSQWSLGPHERRRSSSSCGAPSATEQARSASSSSAVSLAGTGRLSRYASTGAAAQSSEQRGRRRQAPGRSRRSAARARRASDRARGHLDAGTHAGRRGCRAPDARGDRGRGLPLQQPALREQHANEREQRWRGPSRPRGRRGTSGARARARAPCARGRPGRAGRRAAAPRPVRAAPPPASSSTGNARIRSAAAAQGDPLGGNSVKQAASQAT